jgi:hypothetical protein
LGQEIEGSGRKAGEEAIEFGKEDDGKGRLDGAQAIGIWERLGSAGKADGRGRALLQSGGVSFTYGRDVLGPEVGKDSKVRHNPKNENPDYLSPHGRAFSQEIFFHLSNERPGHPGYGELIVALQGDSLPALASDDDVADATRAVGNEFDLWICSS